MVSLLTFMMSAPFAAARWGAEGVGGAVCLSGALSLALLLIGVHRASGGRHTDQAGRSVLS